MPKIKPVILCILDGWGLSDVVDGNAVAQANTPCFDDLISNHPSSTLITHGHDVGLPAGQMGNSEVGHMNIGAGRVVEMGLRRIEAAIENGTYADMDAMQRFVTTMKSSGGTAHLCGLLSDGGVHSHLDHMIATVNILTDAGIPIQLHLFGDGRDVAPKSAQFYLKHMQESIPNSVSIATVTGRYYALDRDNRWERVQTAFAAMMHGEGTHAATAKTAINAAYAADQTDEFIPATVINNYAGMADGDGLLFLNFRADRAREILSALCDPAFDAFETGTRADFAIRTGMAEYSDQHNTYMDTIFPSVEIKNTLGEWVAAKGLKQFRIAETEKYPHVTFFMNGGVEVPAVDEIRYLAPSPKVATYDLKPEMSCGEVTDHLVEAIQSDTYDLIIVNYANPDMVGHTGDLSAAIAACEAVDAGLTQVVDAVTAAGGAMIICADHGNCETMIDPKTGGPHTAHTTNPVPIAMIGAPDGVRLRDGGRLADLAPSLLQLMGLEQPVEMTGESLIIT